MPAAENNDLKYPDDNCPSGKLPGNNAPWRGQKGDLYEGGTRVATVVQWPGRIKSGQTQTPVQITDWMPTLCSLAGFRPQRDLKWDGTNIAPLLTAQQELAERPLYSVAPGWRARSLRFGPWKLIVRGTGEARRVELFDLPRDPGEGKNLAERRPEILQRLLAKLDEVAADDKSVVAGP